MSENTNQPPKGGREGSGQPRGSAKSGKGKLNADIQHKIGQQLRAMYSDVVSEGVPDRFADLIRRLDNKDSN